MMWHGKGRFLSQCSQHFAGLSTYLTYCKKSLSESIVLQDSNSGTATLALGQVEQLIEPVTYTATLN